MHRRAQEYVRAMVSGTIPCEDDGSQDGDVHGGCRCALCIDSRVTRRSNPGDVFAPGSFVIKAAREGFDAVGRRFEELGISIVTSHDDCGAGKIAARLLYRPESDGDATAHEYAARVAQRFGIRHEHISVPVYERHEEEHLVISGISGCFSPRLVDLIGGRTFFLSADAMSHQSVTEGVQIALGISAGRKHSLTRHNPFQIHIVGHPEEVRLSAKVLKEVVWCATRCMNGSLDGLPFRINTFTP